MLNKFLLEIKIPVALKILGFFDFTNFISLSSDFPKILLFSYKNFPAL